LETANSISEISRVISTAGSNPVVVLCDDLNEYVCKYSINTPARRLLIEYLGFCFAKIWDIPIPEGKFVNISSDHVPQEFLSNTFQRRYFETTTIGSLNYPESKEIDKTFIASWKSKPAQLRKILNKEDLLKIGLFDLWLSNEDRNHNNFNLLINSVTGGTKLMAIDHEKCFNTGIIDPVHPPYQISEDESLLTSDLIPLFFRQGIELDGIRDGILQEFPNWVDECRNQLAQILQPLPGNWGINNEEIQNFLNSHIFVPDWRNETEQNFRQYIASNFV
jgi:hypothetical protein